MFGSTSTLPEKDRRPLGQFSNRSATNEMGRVLPIFYGRQRIGCTFLTNFFDISAEPVNNGGKGGASSGTNFYASFAALVAHGPSTKFVDLFLNGDPVFTDTTKLYAVSLSQANNIATFQTKNPHGLPTGATVVIYYAFQPEFNGQFTITVVSATQFQYTIPGSSLANETATAQNGQRIYALVKLDPIVANGADVTPSVTIPDFGTVDIQWGTETQPVNAYLSKVSGIQHPNYLGQIYLVFHRLFLGYNQTSAQNVEVVMEKIPTFAWQSNAAHSLVDASHGTCNPACIIADLLLNFRGGLGITEDDLNLDSFDAGIEQFYTEGVGLCPIWTRGEEQRSMVLSVLENVDASLAIDDDGKIALVLARPPGGPHGPLVITEANLVSIPKFPGDDWSSVVNRSFLTFVDSDAGWVQDFVQWFDPAGILGKERQEPQTLDRPLITSRDLAQRLVNIQGQISALPKKTGTLTLSFDPDLYDSLSPGSAFQFTYTFRPALNSIYRVTSRSIPDPAKPEFEIEVAIDRSYLYTYTANSGNVGNVASPPGPIPPLQPVPAPAPSTIVELPACLCPNFTAAIAALVTRSTQSDRVAALYLGRNYAFNGAAPDSFFPVSTITGFAFTGEMAADFLASVGFTAIANPLPAEAASQNPFPLASGLQIQLEGIDLILPDVSDFDALANSLLLFVGNEIMSVAEATMTDTGAYTLTVIRGRFGTPIEDHHAQDIIWIIPLSFLKPIQHPHFLAGNTAAFKLTIGGENVSDADEFDYQFAGTRWNFKVHFLASDASGSWTADSANITADQDL